MIEEIYQSGPYTFKLKITYRRTRSVTIRVKDDYLAVSCNRFEPRKTVYKLIDANLDKLYQMTESQKQKNEIHLFGKKYLVNIIEDKKNFINVYNNVFEIHTKNTDSAYIEKIVSKYYLEQLKPVVDRLCIRARKFYYPFPEIEYKNLKSVFGQYRKLTNTITLTTKLAKYDEIYIANTLYHELTHTRVSAHNDEFYEEFERVWPNAKKIQHEHRMLRYKDLF